MSKNCCIDNEGSAPQSFSPQARRIKMQIKTYFTFLALLGALAIPAGAQEECGHGSFDSWLAGVREEAEAQGVSAGTLRVLDDIRFDQDIIKRDRAQGVFS